MHFFLLSRNLKEEVVVFFLQVFKLFPEVGFLVIKFLVKLDDFLAGKAQVNCGLILNMSFKIPSLYLSRQNNSIVKI